MSRDRAHSAVGGSSRQIERRYLRLVVGLLVALLTVAVSSSASAAPAMAPGISVAVDISTRDCRAVTVDYRIEWQRLGTLAAGAYSITLRTFPDSYILTSSDLDLGRKAAHSKGKIRGALVRESGYFDAQTFPTQSYQVVVRHDNGAIDAFSNVVPIPACVPMSPLSGLAAGGTLVTVFGGGTFGGPAFAFDTTVTIGGTTTVSPVETAPDGSWLRFVAPPGPAGTCVAVWTDPGLPFPLPSFCYSA